MARFATVMARFATVIARFVRAIPSQGRTSCKTLKSLTSVIGPRWPGRPA